MAPQTCLGPARPSILIKMTQCLMVDGLTGLACDLGIKKPTEILQGCSPFFKWRPFLFFTTQGHATMKWVSLSLSRWFMARPLALAEFNSLIVGMPCINTYAGNRRPRARQRRTSTLAASTMTDWRPVTGLSRLFVTTFYDSVL